MPAVYADFAPVRGPGVIDVAAAAHHANNRVVRVHLIIVAVGRSGRLPIQLFAGEGEGAPAVVLDAGNDRPQPRIGPACRGVHPELRAGIGEK